MPISIVFLLTPQSELPHEHLSRQVQAWFLKQIQTISPELSQKLHDGIGPKPYTVSDLSRQPSSALFHHWFQETNQRAFRITLLDDDLAEFIIDKWLAKKLQTNMKLWWVDFKIEAYTFNSKDHPMAGIFSYADFIQAEKSLNERSVTLDFISPTAFRSEGADIALPIPAHVFRGYCAKWNAFSPEPAKIQDVWYSFASNCIMVSELKNVNTERWIFADGTRGAATGFMGKVSFTLLPKNLCGDWAAIWPDSARIMQTLAAYSFYCGTGHHTTIGLGQTRLCS